MMGRIAGPLAAVTRCAGPGVGPRVGRGVPESILRRRFSTEAGGGASKGQSQAAERLGEISVVKEVPWVRLALGSITFAVGVGAYAYGLSQQVLATRERNMALDKIIDERRRRVDQPAARGSISRAET